MTGSALTASVLLGVACFLLPFAVFLVAPEWVGQAAWVLLLGTTGRLAGKRHPESSWRCGAIIAAVQLAGIALLLVVTGELFHPSSSTGGAVTLVLGSLFVLLFSPVPILASVRGARSVRPRSAGGEKARS